jgi:ferritin-like metal-binding protein YciE
LLAELHWTERTLAFEVLPELRKQAKSEGLVHAIEEHLEQTKEHAKRLEPVFRALGAEPSSNHSPPAQKLQEHHDELASSIPNDRLADCFHAIAAAATEHFELAGYDALLALADAGDLDKDARKALEQNRQEDEQALKTVQSQLERLVGELER